jgi:hypothetical protein
MGNRQDRSECRTDAAINSTAKVCEIVHNASLERRFEMSLK